MEFDSNLAQKNMNDPAIEQKIVRNSPELAQAYRLIVERELHPNPESHKYDDVDTPLLPESARLPEELGSDACQWLDDYIAFSRLWSPRSFDHYHEAVGIWILSTVAARRIKTEFGSPRYPSLYILLTGRSSLYAKTTAAQVGIATLRAVDLTYMLAPDQSTPQKYLNLQATRLPEEYDSLTAMQQKVIKDRLALGGARGWFHEEFGTHVAAMMRPNGHMADFRGLLRIFDDCPETYESATIGRDSDFVDRPYLALLGNLTPADVHRFAQKGSDLWGDGFLARFAIACPPADERFKTGRFPDGMRRVPPELTDPLKRWHKKLGVATVTVEPMDEEDDPPETKNINSRLSITPVTVKTVLISTEVKERLYAYMDGLGQLSLAIDNQDLDGNYIRFPEKALRIATLLASFSESDSIQLNHWARAQAITERWRAGLHALYESVNNDKTPARENEDKVLRIIEKLGCPTPTEISRYIRGMGAGEIKVILDNLVSAGVLEFCKGGRANRYGFPIEQA